MGGGSLKTMGNQETKRLSAGRAVAAGHLMVSSITVFLMVSGGYLGREYAGSPELGIVIALLPAWLWWSFVIPRWRRWALAGGADPDRLQRLGVRTLLLWPKGSFLARTEFPPRDR